MSDSIQKESKHTRVFEVNWGDGWKPCLAQMHRETFALTRVGSVKEALKKAVAVHVENYGQHPITGKDPKFRCGMRIVCTTVLTETLESGAAT